MRRMLCALLVTIFVSVIATGPAVANQTTTTYGGDKYSALRMNVEYSPNASGWTLRRWTQTSYGGSRGGSVDVSGWQAVRRYAYYKPQNGGYTYTINSSATTPTSTNFQCVSANGSGCVYSTNNTPTLWQGTSLSTLLKTHVRTKMTCAAGTCQTFYEEATISWYKGAWS